MDPQNEYYEIEPYWEVPVCCAVTQSGLDEMQLQKYIDEMAVKFWERILYSDTVQDFLCPQGAVLLLEK